MPKKKAEPTGPPFPDILVGSFIDDRTGEGVVLIEVLGKAIQLSPENAAIFALDVIKSAEEAETNEILYEYGKTDGRAMNGEQWLNYMQNSRAMRSGLLHRMKEIDGSEEIVAKKNAPNDMPLSLQAKLGSICVHVEELLGPTGHAFDRTALDQLLRDPEVAAFLKRMGELGVLPVKR